MPEAAGGGTRQRGRPRGSQGAELLDIARRTFLERGFGGTTMDAVAAEARISKNSLYRDYPSKDALYAAVVADWVVRGRDAMRPHLEALLADEDPARGLLRLARILQAGVLSPAVLQMRILVAAEAARSPEVAADYVANSWNRNIAALADAFAELAERDLIITDDPRLAAEQFTWLVLAAPLNEQTLQARAGTVSDPALERIADQAVETFLARFGPRV